MPYQMYHFHTTTIGINFYMIAIVERFFKGITIQKKNSEMLNLKKINPMQCRKGRRPNCPVKDS